MALRHFAAAIERWDEEKRAAGLQRGLADLRGDQARAEGLQAGVETMRAELAATIEARQGTETAARR